MKNDEIETIALFRYGIISPLVTGTFDGTNGEFFTMAAQKIYELKDKKISFSKYTIRRWYNCYISGGFEAIKPKRRADSGHSRKIDEDISKAIIFLKDEYPRLPATIIYEKLVSIGTISPNQISLSTVTRHIKENIKNKNTNKTKDIKRYERKHINQVWCGDSSVGPYIKINGIKNKTYIIALIDDASRMIVGIDIFFNDNTVNLFKVIKQGVTKYGKPNIFNFDNGSNYKSIQTKLMAARIGSVINYNAPRTPISKAKIERWFRTMKDQWMASLNMNDFKSLKELRNSLFEYVQKYNNKKHTSLQDTPLNRFFSEQELIYRLSDEQINYGFLFEIERKVSNDNVVLIDGIEYEVDYRYSGSKINLRYSPDLTLVYVIDELSGEYQEIKLLNKVANSTIKRQKVLLTGDE